MDKYILILWSESQDYMEYSWFRKEAILYQASDEQEHLDSAYFIPEHRTLRHEDMDKIIECKDYVLYDKANNRLVKFEKSGDIVLYGIKEEAQDDCYGNEEVIQFEKLPKDKQKEVLEQIKSNKEYNIEKQNENFNSTIIQLHFTDKKN